ncbi:MAG: hypothetical protein QOJ19_3208 [Acidimicrobiia bacterium]|nr:hypothetical protein [Acidimicrobiia bacterium]
MYRCFLGRDDHSSGSASTVPTAPIRLLSEDNSAVMWSTRNEPFKDLVMAVDLSPEKCLDVVDYLARQAGRYGIEHRIELRRNPSGQATDRHDVLGIAGGKLSWAMAVVLTPLDEETTRVLAGVTRYRRGRAGLAEGRSGEAFGALLLEGLTAAVRPRRAVDGNVIPLFSYVPVGALAS